MNRHERRASVSSIRHSDLITHLVDADAVLDDAILRSAVLYWRGNLDVRKPVCIGCKASFLHGDARVGGFLFAIPVSVGDLVSTSVFCARCWDTLPAGEVDRISTRVLRQLAPNGKFLDPPR